MKLSRRAALGAIAAAPVARPALLRAQTSSAPVKIGLLSDVAGPYRHVGGPGSRLTAEMAVADFGGSVLGRPIEVMQADDQNKADVAGALAREWVDDKGVHLLADGAATSAGLAIQQVARDKKRIFVMSTPTATAFIGKQCSPYGFQFAADTYALAKGVGNALASWRQGAGQHPRTTRHGRLFIIPSASTGIRRQGDRPRQRGHGPAELHQAGS